jgi:phenylpropionate dioxygenase-like ring-hydroxylating dioxygenase large terminal subunit
MTASASSASSFPEVTPRFPFPIPTGWFPVARSAEVAAGTGRPVHYFGQDLVVWRGSSGVAAVFDAYCAHLGAPLGVGKGPLRSPEPGPPVITGDCIQCQFHGWRYDAGGTCVEIPYSAAPIPAQARVRSWPVLEVNGLIFAWHHADGEPPAWTLPVIPEFDDPAWVEPIYTDRIIASCLQEVGENDVDFAHFQFVHGLDAPRPGDVTFADGGRVKITTGHPRVGSDGVERQGLRRESHQLGWSVVHLPDRLTFMSASAPIDVEHMHQRWILTYPSSFDPERGTRFVETYTLGINEDIPLWESKIYRDKPMLRPGDGPIDDFRRWAAQFYVPPV